MANFLPKEKQVAVIASLVEGNSIRAAARMTGVSKPTILRLLRLVGQACAAFHDRAVRGLHCRRVQCDEIWAFVGAKQKQVDSGANGLGDVWTWVAMCADTKLIVSYLVGLRDAGYASEFLHDLKSRVAHRIQLTTDGHRVYLEAVEDAFGGDIDYAQLVKLYGPERDRTNEVRYSPSVCRGTRREPVCGKPDRAYISTSFVERQNLTMRMSMRRFTRLTNAFSKKLENHEAAVALHFMYYNFCRIHQSLRITPAMAAGVTQHVWEVEEIVALLK